MGQYSRVKRNKDLYKEIIEDDKNSEIIESSYSDYERRTTDPKSKESRYQTRRLKSYEDKKLSNEEPPFTMEEEERAEKSKKASLSKKEILRDRDLLDEFIEEVKHYNINRGLRNVQDTQMNILQSLNKNQKKDNTIEDESTLEDENTYQPKEKKVDSQEEAIEADVEEDLHKTKSDMELTQEIEAIISELEKESIEEDLEKTSDNFVFKPLEKEQDSELSQIVKDIEDKPKEKIKYKKDENKKEPEKESESKPDFKTSELHDLTQTLSLKLDLQEEEINEVSEKVSLIDKVLTFFVIVLLIFLIVVIAYGIYWVYVERGGF